LKKIIFSCALVIFSVAILHFSAELVYSLFISEKVPYRYDRELGWVAKSDFVLHKNAYDNFGHEYQVDVSTNSYGFRAWGKINTDKKKILFIGDSYTGDPNMSDDDSYFGQVGKLTGYEIFAYGGGGYGTLQELMILKKYVKMIDPDVFVLQFCENDFENNSFDFEGSSIVRNQKNLRPYLDGEKIIYRIPDDNWYRYLYVHSVVFRFSDIILQNIQYKIYNDYRSSADNDKEKIDREMLKAVRITGTLLKMMAKAVPSKTKLASFPGSTEDHAMTERWDGIAKEAGFATYPDVSLAVEKAEKEGVFVRAADGGHWGPAGHIIAGRVLARDITKLLHVNQKKTVN